MQVSNYLRGAESYADFAVMAGKTFRYRVVALDAFHDGGATSAHYYYVGIMKFGVKQFH